MASEVISTGDVILSDIIASPGDDGLRLIFADWLEDAGDPDRAAFIRVQVELQRFSHAENVRTGEYDARDGVDAAWAEAFRLHDEEMRLLWGRHPSGSANWGAWCWAESRGEDGEPCPASGRGGMTVTPHGSPGLRGESTGVTIPTDAGDIGQVFRRGLVARVRCPLAAWLLHGPALAASQPLTRVELSDRRPAQGGAGGRWVWFHEDVQAGLGAARDMTIRLPGAILGLLGGFDNGGISPHRVRFYNSRDEADDALSDALLAWAGA